jgi:restriction system protein
VKRSRAVVRRFRGGREESLAALHAVSAHEFEEVVLTALARRGHRIKRSRRYTGDGGWDGEVRVRRGPFGLFGHRRFLIQSKRYQGAIRAEHIDEFRQVCRLQRARGLFVHTGRMGPSSLEADARARRVAVLYGADLARLVAGRGVRLEGVSL